MRVLLAPIGSRGDLQPLLVLGEELRRRGHEVSFATCPNFVAGVRSEGFESLPIGSDSHEMILQNAALAEQNPVTALPRQLRLLSCETERQCRDLLGAGLGRFDLVVAAGLSFAARLLAERQGARYSFVCYSQSAVPSALHPPAALPIFGLPRWANRALWWLVIAGFTRAVAAPLGRARRAHGLAADARPWLSTHASNAILAQDELLGSLPSDASGHAAHVPALARGAGPAELPAAVTAFLERGSGPRVYVGFGSMPSVQRARVIEAVAAFVQAHAARVLLFSAHAEDTGRELPSSVLSVGALDHARLFPRLDLVVHHGGAGTTAAALRAGVPQLIVPHILDQFFHGRRIAELGLGPVPAKKRALRERLLALSWSDVAAQRQRAARVAERLSPSGAPGAADYLEQLARS
jgi:vancomycin aglycone glucosyltransferase